MRQAHKLSVRNSARRITANRLEINFIPGNHSQLKVTLLQIYVYVNIKIYLSFLDTDALCELICINNDNAFVNLAPRVIDGTSCKPGSKDKCIGGTCRVCELR